VHLPKPVTPDAADYDEDREEIGGYGGGAGKKAPVMEVKFNVVQKIDHKGEVNKARYQPHNPNIIATMCTDGRVMIWDRTKHPSLPTGHVNPQMELIGHTEEGFGLSWSPHESGHIATGSEDQTVRLWFVSWNILRVIPAEQTKGHNQIHLPQQSAPSHADVHAPYGYSE
jgi:histone-binding protein RBBP4